MLPFNRGQFLDVFERYNAALWPASLVAYGLAALAVAMILTGREQPAKVTALVLFLMWAWTGTAYHLGYFAAINGAATIFGLLFLLQAALCLRAAFLGRWQLAAWSGWWSGVAWALIAYAAVAYPLIGLSAGHRYAELPQFGVTPCPVTLFTFGLLLLSKPPYPWLLTVIPFIWSLVGGSAAFLLGVPQDYVLLASGVVSLLLIWRTGKVFAA